MKDTTRNALDFANPGPLPTALMDMPGFVNGLKEYTLRTAPRPNEVLAFAGALAMLRAISRDDQNPVMDAPDIDWAAMLATHLTKRMIYMAQFYVSEGKFDSLKKRMLAALSMAGGEMSRSELLRRLHVDSATFRKVVLTLHMCEMIEEECISRNKVIYTLKNAA